MTTTYRRASECMLERINSMLASAKVASNTSFLVTTQGFAPDVAAGLNRGRPSGSEVWLQSQVTISN